MLKRCIMIFPEFKNQNIINEIRERYDPLASHVRPHITLVFPFDSCIKTAELKNHLTSGLAQQKIFDIVLGGFTLTRSYGNYLFLNIKKGKERIINIHRNLYTGILEGYYPEWLKNGFFLPHMTVGCIEDEKAFLEAADKIKGIDDLFQTTVEEISVEIIDENEDSIIELNIPLS